jgi:hypothetical protein
LFSPPPPHFFNPPPDNGIIEYRLPRKIKYKTNKNLHTEDLEDEPDPQDADNSDIDEEYHQIIWPVNNYQIHTDIENDDIFNRK